MKFIQYILAFIGSLVFMLFNAIIFFIFQVIASISPMIVGGLAAALFNQIGDDWRPVATLFTFAALITTLLVFLSTFRVLFFALGFSKPSGKTNNSKILNLFNEVSTELNVRPFKIVYLSPNISIGTYSTLFGRYLVFSLLSLKFLSVKEIKAVIAHEFAHHSHASMLFYRVYYRTHMFNKAINSSLEFVSGGLELLPNTNTFNYLSKASSITILVNRLFAWLFGIYLKLIGILIQNKNNEYSCDLVAANYAGGNVLASAIEKLTKLKISLRLCANDNVGNDEFLTTIEKYFYEIDTKYSNELQNELNAESATHPSSQNRISKVTLVNNVQVDDKRLFDKTEFQILWEEFV